MRSAWRLPSSRPARAVRRHRCRFNGFDVTLGVRPDGAIDVRETLAVRFDSPDATRFERRVALERADSLTFESASIDGTRIEPGSQRQHRARRRRSPGPHGSCGRFRPRLMRRVCSSSCTGRTARSPCVGAAAPIRHVAVPGGRAYPHRARDRSSGRRSRHASVRWRWHRGSGLDGLPDERWDRGRAHRACPDRGRDGDGRGRHRSGRHRRTVLAAIRGLDTRPHSGVRVGRIVHPRHRRRRAVDRQVSVPPPETWRACVDRRRKTANGRVVRTGLRTSGLVAVVLSLVLAVVTWLTLSHFGWWPMSLPVSILAVGLVFLAVGRRFVCEIQAVPWFPVPGSRFWFKVPDSGFPPGTRNREADPGTRNREVEPGTRNQEPEP